MQQEEFVSLRDWVPGFEGMYEGTKDGRSYLRLHFHATPSHDRDERQNSDCGDIEFLDGNRILRDRFSRAVVKNSGLVQSSVRYGYSVLRTVRYMRSV